MDIFDISVTAVNSGILRETVRKGQKVKITRMVTVEYEVDITEFLEDSDEDGISVEDLIQHEMDNNLISVDLEYSAETDIAGDEVIAVEIR